MSTIIDFATSYMGSVTLQDIQDVTSDLRNGKMPALKSRNLRTSANLAARQKLKDEKEAKKLKEEKEAKTLKESQTRERGKNSRRRSLTTRSANKGVNPASSPPVKVPDLSISPGMSSSDP